MSRKLSMILPALQADALQLWKLEFVDTSGLEELAESFLTQDEIARAQRLRAGRVRNQFVTARASLRHLLGHFLDMHPMQVTIRNSSHGKPEAPNSGLFFNVTHSGGTALVALSRQYPIGVDIELVNPETDVMELASHSFSATECSKLDSLTPNERQRAFFQCWARKEAVLKADGRGLSIPLSSFDVPVDSATGTAVTLAQPDGHRGKIYFVSDIHLGDGFAGAFAMETRPASVQMLTIPIRAFLESESKA